MISNSKLKKMMNGSRNARVAICERYFLAFATWYFREFFTYAIADFHKAMYRDLIEMMKGEFDFLMWVMFRESAKTSIAKIFVVWCICYKKKRFINFDSYDKDNAEASIFDIAVWLQTNQKLIADFGHLYIEQQSSWEKKTIKRLNEFITTNDIKVKGYSTQESTRGRIYKEFRPDLYVIDDFETFKTKDSAAVTQKIMGHIDEMKSGIAPGANIIFLCNLITESGNVQALMNAAKEDPKFRVRRVDVEMDGVIQWPDKYVRYDREAADLNKDITDPRKVKVSLQSKKRTLNAGGRRVYEVEMMNDPASAGDIIFDRTKMDAYVLKAKDPIEDLAGFRVWERFNPKHRYAIGADTSKGVGRDHNASVCIDFSGDKSRVVGTYKNNQIAPDIFAHELKRQGDIFGSCLVAPEVNNTGYATITELKRIYKNIYARVTKDKAVDAVAKNPELGFDTNRATRPEIIYQLKSAVEDGLLEIPDVELLRELRLYTQTDMENFKEVDSTVTRHFDMLMACAIAWEMRNYAKVTAEAKKPYVQKPWQSSSPYEGRK